MKLSINRIIYTIIVFLSMLFLIFIISTNIVPLKYLLLLFVIFILYDVGLLFLLFKKHKIKIKRPEHKARRAFPYRWLPVFLA